MSFGIDEEEHMTLYAAIDLHANNGYLAVIDETDELVIGKRLPNDIELVRRELEPYREQLTGRLHIPSNEAYASFVPNFSA